LYLSTVNSVTTVKSGAASVYYDVKLVTVLLCCCPISDSCDAPKYTEAKQLHEIQK